jgi:uncharacterized membrane protein
MAIEFRCTQCGKLLRTGDDTVGKHAKCPECGAVMVIPANSSAPDGAAPQPLGGGSSADSGNPYQSPAPAAPSSSSQPQGAITPTVLDLNDIFSRTWAIFKEQWGACLVGWLVIVVLSFAIGYGLGIASSFAARAFFGPDSVPTASGLASVLTQLIGVWLGIGLAIYSLKIARGEPAEIADLFSGGPHYIAILLATLLFALITLVGFVLCVVPGVIFALMFSQFYYLVLDRRVGVVDSLRQSSELTSGNKMTLFLIWLVAVGLSIVAMIPCGLGLLVAGPFFMLMKPVIYLTITGQPTANQTPFGSPR